MEEPESKVLYVPGYRIPDYNDYCPIASTYATKQPDGSWLTAVGNVSIQEGEYLETPGFLVMHLGAIEDDYTVETAADAIFNSLRSLFAGCGATEVGHERVRTTVELSEYLKLYRCNYSHLILIGHGSPDGVEFIDRSTVVGGSELAGMLGGDAATTPLQIISLCCHSGCAKLSHALSRAENVTEVIAPNSAFDMRWAVHFVTGYLLQRFVSGLRVDDAVEKAVANSGNTNMCLWRNGELVGKCADQNAQGTVGDCAVGTGA